MKNRFKSAYRPDDYITRTEALKLFGWDSSKRSSLMNYEKKEYWVPALNCLTPKLKVYRFPENKKEAYYSKTQIAELKRIFELTEKL